MKKWAGALAFMAVCGAALSTCNITIESHSHQWAPGDVIKEATCTSTGIHTSICQLNTSHIQYNEIPIDPSRHDVDQWTVISTATCQYPGWSEGICAECGETAFQYSDQLAHQGTWETMIKPGCVLAGREVMDCTVCKERAGRNIPALGHIWKSLSTGRQCTRCYVWSLL